MPCELKEMCEAYQDNNYTSMFKENFRETCDNTNVQEGVCPIYDSYTKLFKMISGQVEKLNTTAERIASKLEQKTESLQSD
ncbi:MAG: hypothetical protein U9R08_00365 [Nanoarchaeota archaeon]|nr:hypothetical protein [Nanoarchaeota archaeon]